MHARLIHAATILLSFATSIAFAGARADEPARAWEFELKDPGRYRVQAEHSVDGLAPGTKVSYSVSVGKEARTHDLALITNRPFVLATADIPGPLKVRVSIAGLTVSALEQTRVYIDELKSFEPARSADFEEVRVIRNILKRPEDKIDLGRTKLIIDRMIDPSIDVASGVRKLDAMAAGVRAMPEYGASSASRLEALRRYVYVSGTWNGHRPFEYDLDDPLGANIKNKLLPTYLSSRKGNCVSMPLLLVILGQRLAIEVTASLVPKHVFVKYRDELGTWINLEATSGANPARDVWVREQSPFTDEALANGLYMQPLTKKETVAVMAGTLGEHLLRQGEYEKAIAVSDLALAYYPKDVAAMLSKATGYGRIARTQFEEKYPSPSRIPADERGYFEYLIHQHRQWVSKAERLGWREETKEDRDKYLWSIKQARARSGAN